MFTPDQYRAKAKQYTELAKTANNSGEREEFRNLQLTYSVMADNEQWLADHFDQTVHAASDTSKHREDLAAEEKHVLQCLGAALIMQWNTLPTKLRKEIFDNAGSMGALLDDSALRAQIAGFLHKRKDDEADAIDAPAATRIEQMQSQ